ncbi:MAG: hypothetical protein HFH59_06755 [Lachnospiraceae bacterium]|nr:hypothetical protein [Lachnospiraceae bacterium]
MSMINLYPYGDGITKISDPFWMNICLKCGHMFWSCSVVSECPKCGGPKLRRTLGEVPYEQIAARRGKLSTSDAGSG